jgi:hypothetical protein
MPKSSAWSFTANSIFSALALALAIAALIQQARHHDLICGTGLPGLCSPVLLDDTGQTWHRLEFTRDQIAFSSNYSLPLAEGRLTRLWLQHSMGTEIELCGGLAVACQEIESAACLDVGLVAPCGYLRGKIDSELGELVERDSHAYQLRLATEGHPTLAQCGVWQGSCHV